MTNRIDEDKLIVKVEAFATSIDFDDFDRKRIIQKHGSRCKVFDIKKLLERAIKQIEDIKSNSKDTITSIQFLRKWKSSPKLYRKITGKKFVVILILGRLGGFVNV